MSKLFNVSASPHDRSPITTTTIMADVLIALFPASAWGVYRFGWNAFFLILACVLTSVLTELVYEVLMKKPITIHDLSAFVTGLLLALNLSPRLPIWIAVLGSVFAILIVKMLYGGIGQNFMNPALAARCFLLISFGKQMSAWGTSTDAISGATPLQLLKDAKSMAAADVLSGNKLTLWDMFVGNKYGCIGEVSILMLLIGAAYLLIRRVINWRIPVLYIGTFTILMGLYTGFFTSRGFDLTYLAAEVCSGGLVIGAFYMATDYTTSPITRRGKVYFGIVLGLVTWIFRTWGGTAEGVSYAIIFCNLLVPLIEKISLPTAFGRKEAAKNVSN